MNTIKSGTTGIIILFLISMGHQVMAAPATEDPNQSFFGLEGVLTPSGIEFGPTFLIRGQVELSVLTDYTKTQGAALKTDNLEFELRAGKLFQITQGNFLTVGLDYDLIFGHDAGVSTQGTYQTGPYVGFRRLFSGTNLMLEFFVEPYAYNHVISNDSNGNKAVVNSVQILANGGVGVGYIF